VFAPAAWAYDSGASALDGIYANCTLYGAAGGAEFDDSNLAYVWLPHSTIDALWNPNEYMSFCMWRVDDANEWTDGSDNKPYTFRNGSNNYSIFETGTSELHWYHRANGTLSQVAKLAYSPTNTWVTQGMYVSQGNDQMKAYLNGTQEGGTQTGLGTWSLSLAGAAIGTNIDTSGPYYTGQMWNGRVKELIMTLTGADTSNPDTKASDISAKLAAGTLTAANLNSHFGAGKWARWRLNETASYAGAWYDPLEASLPIAGAYEASGAANYAASLVNLSNPGVNNLTEYNGVVPWTAAGWGFVAGSAQALITGLTPESTWAHLWQFENWTSDNTITGSEAGSARFYFFRRATDIIYGFGGTATKVPTLNTGVLGCSARRCFRDGTYETTTTAWTGGTGRSIYIGCRNDGSPDSFITATGKRYVAYNGTVTDEQMNAIARVVAYLG
jgi:hypothetical protein